MGFVDIELNGIDIIVIKEGPRLNNKQREDMIAPIGDLKSPGVDVYGAYFYKKA